MTTKLATCLEGELVSLLRAGQEPALAELFRRFEARLYAYALKFTRQQELAEEILQDVFVSLWEYRAEIDTSLPLGALLYRMTRNKILNVLRQETRLARQRKTYSFSMEVSRDLTEERVVLNDYHRIMDKAIENLPTQRRSIFKMNHLDGMSYDEIAETLGISRNTVRNQMIKSMKYVRDFLSANVDLNINMIVVLHLLTYLA